MLHYLPYRQHCYIRVQCLRLRILWTSISWPAGLICPTYTKSFQVRWGNSIPLFLHAAIYLEVSLFRWTSQNAFSLETAVYKRYYISIVCTQLFRGKMHSAWFNGIEILQGRWQHGEIVGYCYPSGLEKTLCKWDIYVLLVTKGLNVWLMVINIYILSWIRERIFGKAQGFR